MGKVGPPRGPMFRNSGGVGTPPRAVIFREFAYFTYLIPAVIPLIPARRNQNPPKFDFEYTVTLEHSS